MSSINFSVLLRRHPRIRGAAYKTEACQKYTPDYQMHNPQRGSGDGLQ